MSEKEMSEKEMSEINPDAQGDTPQDESAQDESASANLESSALIAVANTIPPDELSKILKVESNMVKLGPLIAVVVAELSKIKGLREEINTLFEAKTAENQDFKTALKALNSNLIEIYNSSKEKEPASGSGSSSGGRKRRRTKKRKHYKKRRSTKHR